MPHNLDTRDLGDLMFSRLKGARRGAPSDKLVRPFATLAMCVVACMVLSSCTPGDVAPESPGSQTPGTGPTPTSTAAAPDPDDVPPDDTDYSKDAGNTPTQYEYEPDEEPAESVVATLCNLNQTFFDGLRNVESGTAVTDSDLRTNLVGLGDLVDYWDTLREQYADATPDIDTATEIYELWMTAVLDEENGDSAAAERGMAAAEKLIEKLPETSSADCGR